MVRKSKFVSITAVVLAWAATAHAQSPVDVGGTFQQIGQAANDWIPVIMQNATYLFYGLAALDFAWGAPQLLRENDFMGLFLSLIKKLLVISFFYAVLVNGQTSIPAIVNTFAQLGANAAGIPQAQSPSDIMAQGLQIVSDLFTKIKATNLLAQPGGGKKTNNMCTETPVAPSPPNPPSHRNGGVCGQRPNKRQPPPRDEMCEHARER